MVVLRFGFGLVTLAESTVITCGGCDNKWTGPARCHHYAAGCHLTFGGRVYFDKHLQKDKEDEGCITDESLLEAMGLHKNSHGIWVGVYE